MPTTDAPALIVARYLKANHYAESYEAFVAEAGLPPDAGEISKGDLTLETLLEEKRTFDLSLRFEKLGLREGSSAWNDLAPIVPHEVSTLPSASNILSVGLEELGSQQGKTTNKLFVSTADRQLHILDGWTTELHSSNASLHDSPILSSTTIGGDHVATASMSGQLHISDSNFEIIEKRKDHAKYIVKIAHYSRDGQSILATAGWDNKINVYRPTPNSGFHLGEPTAVISLPTKPEALLFLEHPDNPDPILLVSRADSSFVFYYTTDAEARLLGRQNLAPHSNAWVAFTPSALAQCPTDPTLVAIGTSAIPHMKLLITRLLFPPWDGKMGGSSDPGASRPGDTNVPETQASQAREALALADREEAAIKIHCTTMAPQTAYSTPAVAWRPDGSGVWVNGDDGVVRGIEASTGKVVSALKGHVAGSKVRCLWAGHVQGPAGREEVMVSGGFDHKLIVWKTK